jgi:hypothetical protein
MSGFIQSVKSFFTPTPGSATVGSASIPPAMSPTRVPKSIIPVNTVSQTPLSPTLTSGSKVVSPTSPSAARVFPKSIIPGNTASQTPLSPTRISPKSPSGSKSGGAGGVRGLDNQVTSVCEHVFTQPDGQILCYTNYKVASDKKSLAFNELKHGVDDQKILNLWAEQRLAVLEIENRAVRKIFVSPRMKIEITNNPIRDFFLYNKEQKSLSKLPMAECVTIDIYFQTDDTGSIKEKNDLIDEFCPKGKMGSTLKILPKSAGVLKREVYQGSSTKGKITYIVQDPPADDLTNIKSGKFYLKKRISKWPFFKNKEQCAFVVVPLDKDIDLTKLEKIRDRRAIVWINTNKDGRVEEMTMSSDTFSCLDRQNIKDFFICRNEQGRRILTRMPMVETVKVNEIYDNEYDRRMYKTPQMASSTTVPKVCAHSSGNETYSFRFLRPFTIHYPRK